MNYWLSRTNCLKKPRCKLAINSLYKKYTEAFIKKYIIFSYNFDYVDVR